MPATLGGRWAWLTPVMACFLAVLVVSGARQTHLPDFSSAPTTNWLAAVASNQSYAAYIVANFHSGQNGPQREPIAWTNGPRGFGDLRPVLFGKTNSLIN